ncbi:MAG: DUF1289 domain-containing protein [Gammaproteobacteria bacterium]
MLRSPEPIHPPPPVNLQDARQRHLGQAFPSPCVSICRMNATSGLCEGCFRTLEEIARWGAMDNGAREATWARIEQRQRNGP